ncbi:uncharacterized protein LY89DRAFT_738140 [Mollisia scopiformis]|uniref:Rhodopsin domain-containing protein n=1 Tax=Mollisia scopiformis TaxID=149040 RepID=A0A194WXN7_MOLSC|nr:uncharacterized protein LY89DRAFT_738140 [Mollisia scopiformis]KUJ12352.1 hypothetical protein LY89DRAFT_738140 [Mollisia scopiformis]
MTASVTVQNMPPSAQNRLGMRLGCYVLFALATIAILIRAYVRLFVSRKIGLDDLLILTAWIAETVAIVAVKEQFESGIGFHVADIMSLPNAPDVLTKMVLWPWVAQITYFFGLGCIKASIVALYLRLAVNPFQRKILWVALIFVFCQGLSSAITVAAFLCSPISIVWTGSHGGFGGPACVNILAFNYYNAALFIATDLALALAPIAVLKHLQMDKKKKASLAVMFSLGLLAIGGTISRQVTNAIAIINTADFTWYWAPAELCSVLESSLGIIFVCVPAMAPLFKGVFGNIGSSGGKYNKYNDGENLNSDRPSTFGKLGGRPRLRPDDESILCQTQITTVDPKERDAHVEAYEMDLRDSGDASSERRIITPPKESQVKVEVEYGVKEYSSRRASRVTVK